MTAAYLARRKSVCIAALALLATGPLAAFARADGQRADVAPVAGDHPQGGAAAAPRNERDRTTTSLTYYPNGALKSVTLHCASGMLPRVDYQAGVAQPSCQPSTAAVAHAAATR